MNIEPKIERRKKQHYVAIRTIVPIPFGKYLQPAWNEGKGILKSTVALLDWAKENKIKWNTSKKKGVEWWNGHAEFYFSDPATEKDRAKFKAELAFLIAG
jgi:hypothetical protein